jgi:hypothetical protein
VEETVETIKRLSWQWFIGRMAITPCLFYEWRWNPGVCFNRRYGLSLDGGLVVCVVTLCGFCVLLFCFLFFKFLLAFPGVIVLRMGVICFGVVPGLVLLLVFPMY